MNDLTLIHVAPRRASGKLTAPLGCLYLISTLRVEGFDVDFRDFQTLGDDAVLSPKSVLTLFRQPGEVLGVSCLSEALPIVLLALKSFQDEHPEIPIVLGGAGPTIAAVALVSHFPWITAIVMGEGERTLPDLLRALKRGSDLMEVPGLVFSRDGGPVVTSPRQAVSDLDRLPWPAHDVISYADYQMPPISVSRGCPWNCTFCCASIIWPKGVRSRSLDSVFSEIEFLVSRYKCRSIDILDFNFAFNRDRVFDFCDRMSRTSPPVAWCADVRIDQMNDDIVKRMADTRCQGLLLGLESGSQKILRRIGKGFDLQDVTARVERAIRSIDTIVCFMWGFPYETYEDFLETVFLMLHLRQEGARVECMLLTPYLGTSITREGWTLRGYPDLIRQRLPANGNDEIFDFIQQHADLFQNFLNFETPDMERKMELIRNIGFRVTTH